MKANGLRIFQNFLSLFLCVLMAVGVPAGLGAQEASGASLENFRQTSQKAALLGIANEFIETNLEEAITRDLRRSINRYTNSFGASDIANFRIPNNPAGQFFKPNERSPEPQLNFLRVAASENEIDILVLALIRESAVGMEIELQLYDARIQVFSGIERTSFPFAQRVSATEDVTYRIFDYLDREGFVHPSRQGFLKPPARLGGALAGDAAGLAGDDFFILPRDLTGPSLAGRTAIGGDKTPFWEEWWFWTAIFGGMAMASGVSYYFLVAQRPRQTGSVTFQYTP
jgi:hypothetical protein